MRLYLIFFLLFHYSFANSQRMCMSVNGATKTISISLTNNTASTILVTSIVVTINDDNANVVVNEGGNNRVGWVGTINLITLASVSLIDVPYSTIGSGTVNFSLSSPFGEINSIETSLAIGPGCSPISASFSPLPITLSTFSATKHSDRASKLDWKTSSEINSAYFGIERSRDGDTWETIGKVSAAGNSHTELTYEYIDDRLPFSRTADQIYYYRLRLTDQDGSHKYSDIKAVNFSRKTSDGIAIYPNPSTQMVHLDISTMDASAGDIDLRIYDIHGRIMVDKQIIGAGIEPIDVTQYPTGTYQVSVTQGTTQHQKRFIKIE